MLGLFVEGKGLTKLYLSFKSAILPPFCKCCWIAFLSSSIFLKIKAPREFSVIDISLFFHLNYKVHKILKVVIIKICKAQLF